MEISTDVLVVGAGPAGLTLGLLLAGQGVAVACVDKHQGVSMLPRARGIHARAAEILRVCGVENDMLAAQVPITPHFDMRPDLPSASTGGVVTGGAALVEVSPSEGIAIAQDVFEHVLREHVTRAGIPIHAGAEMLGYVITPSGVVVDLLDRGTGSRFTASCRYLVGADGSRSRVREAVGAVAEGPDGLGSNRAVSFRADLDTWLPDPPPALVLLTTTQSMLLRTHDDHRWVVNKNAGEEDPVDAGEWVREAIGLPDLELDVISDWTWTAAAQLADRFSDGPVFLVGDAAHRVPPAGATGISSAMADAHNLAWKLAAVLQGWGGTSLLDSCAAERRQVGEATTRAALELWESRENPGQAAIDLRMIDMGYVYGEPGSLVDDLAGPYEQGTRPGGRAPHVWLQGDDHGRSTLDLFGPGFTVLATDEGQVWEAAASLAAKRTAVPLMACVRSEPAIRAAYGLSRGEAVLVRPDGHVACRLPPTPRPVDAGELLAAELERVTDGRL